MQTAHWDRGFGFHWGYGYVRVFLYSVLKDLVFTDFPLEEI